MAHRPFLRLFDPVHSSSPVAVPQQFTQPSVRKPQAPDVMEPVHVASSCGSGCLLSFLRCFIPVCLSTTRIPYRFSLIVGLFNLSTCRLPGRVLVMNNLIRCTPALDAAKYVPLSPVGAQPGPRTIRFYLRRTMRYRVTYSVVKRLPDFVLAESVNLSFLFSSWQG